MQYYLLVTLSQSPQSFYFSCSATTWISRSGTQKTRCLHVHALIDPRPLGSLHQGTLRIWRQQVEVSCKLSLINSNHMKAISQNSHGFFTQVRLFSVKPLHLGLNISIRLNVTFINLFVEFFHLHRLFEASFYKINLLSFLILTVSGQK